MSKQLIEKILSNSASLAEKKIFDKWLEESPDNQKYYNQSKIIWQRVDGVFTKVNIDQVQAKQTLYKRLQRKRQRNIQMKWIPRIAVAASILLILSLFILKSNNYSKLISEVYTSTNVIQDIQLSDGTQVWLNNNSTLSISKNFAKKDRTVFLRGEAYFEVAKDQKKPFKVIAGKTVTNVLGTHFNVRLDSLTGNVEVGLLNGKVSFYKSGDKKHGVILEAGKHAIYNSDNNKVLISEKSNVNYLAWKNKLLIFNETPLAQVCEDLSRCYGANITSGSINQDVVLLATFRNETLENILTSISLSLDLETNYKSNQYILTPRTNQTQK